MSAKYFSPKCIRPLFLQKTEGDAKRCGFTNGIVYCALLTLIIGAAGGRFYFHEENSEKQKKILYLIIGILSAIWIVIPLISWYGEGTMWVGYQDVIKDLMDQGYTRQQALSFIQGISDTGPQLGLAQGISAMVFAKSQEGETGETKAVKTEEKEEKDINV